MDMNFCNVCKKEASKKCSGCHSVFYCSVEHQKSDWKEHKQVCSAIMTIEENPTFGKQWVAARDLAAGTLLLNEEPALQGIQWPPADSIDQLYKSVSSCLSCGMHIFLEFEFYKCSTCSWPMCDPECENSPLHKTNECKIFKESQFSFPPNKEFISPHRIDLAVDLIRASKMKQSNPWKFKSLMSLQSRPSLPQSPEKMHRKEEDACTMKYNFDFISNQLTDTEILKLPWIRRLNGFRCDNQNDDSEIHCVYLKASIFSNSCSPNCMNSVQPKAPDYKMQVRTAVAVKKGEPLTIAYCAQFQEGTAERQNELRDFYFICKCPRCLDPTELGTYVSAVTCSSCYGETKQGVPPPDANEGYFLAEDPLNLDENAMWKCNRCSKTTPFSSFSSIISKLEEEVNKEPLCDALFYNTIIQENKGKVLHKNHSIILKAIGQMTESFLKSGEMDTDLEKFNTHHALAVINRIFPGISFYRARHLRGLAMLLHALIMRSRTEDLVQEMMGLLEDFKEAISYYTYFENEVVDGESSLRSLTEAKNLMRDENYEIIVINHSIGDSVNGVHIYN